MKKALVHGMPKRLLDIVISGVVIVLLSPLLVIIFVLVRCYMGRPVLYRQLRPGKDGKPFHLLKFRTMSDMCDTNDDLLQDEQRLTRFGRLLRASSLDELPELFNVLKGDMSLVGPRPLLMEYLPLYSPEQRRRHEVRPGMTGWAQINGRNTLSWEEKFKLDVWYVDNQSLWQDMKILLITLVKIITREGISAEGEVTMPRFRGSDEGKSE